MTGAHAARVHGPVRQAAQLAGAKACCPQVGDDGAVCLGDLVVCIDRHAGAQGGDADVLVDAIEGRSVDATFATCIRNSIFIPVKSCSRW